MRNPLPSILKKLMDDPRYWDGDHPEHADMVRQVSEKFEQAQAGKLSDEWAPPKDPKLWSEQRADPESDAAFGQEYGKLLEREGGYTDKLKDGAGPTHRGITQKTLDGLNAQHPDWKLPKTTAELTEPQTEFVYREEYFYNPRYHELPKLPGMSEQAPNLPAAVMDTGVNHGKHTGNKMMQKALEDMYGVKLHGTDKSGKAVYDGDIGPATRSIMQRALNDGRGAELYERFLERRKKAIEQSNDEHKKGLLNRVQKLIDMGPGSKPGS